MKNNKRAENLYLEVFDIISENGDYFQPKDLRYLLPEVVITIVTSSIFLSFFEGVFGKLGENLTTSLKDKFFKNKNVETIETDKVIELLSTLNNKNNKIDYHFIEDSIIEKLEDFGLSKNKREKLSKQIITIIKHNIPE